MATTPLHQAAGHHRGEGRGTALENDSGEGSNASRIAALAGCHCPIAGAHGNDRGLYGQGKRILLEGALGRAKDP